MVKCIQKTLGKGKKIIRLIKKKFSVGAQNIQAYYSISKDDDMTIFKTLQKIRLLITFIIFGKWNYLIKCVFTAIKTHCKVNPGAQRRGSCEVLKTFKGFQLISLDLHFGSHFHAFKCT